MEEHDDPYIMVLADINSILQLLRAFLKQMEDLFAAMIELEKQKQQAREP